MKVKSQKSSGDLFEKDSFSKLLYVKKIEFLPALSLLVSNLEFFEIEITFGYYEFVDLVWVWFYFKCFQFFCG